MSRYGDLMGGITSSTEVVPPAPVVDTAPASVEQDDVIDFNTMSKLELEEYGRTIGIELDRRKNKGKLIEELYDKFPDDNLVESTKVIEVESNTFVPFGGLTNPASSGVTGDIMFTTVGHSSADSYTIIMQVRKSYD